VERDKPVERVLIVALPGLAWEDLEAVDTPNLDSIVADGAVANLSVRVTGLAAERGEGYATIGAGSRAVAPPEVAGLALAPEERYGAGDAAQAFERRTGHPLDGAAGQLAIEELERENDRSLFGAELGMLSEELDGAGVDRAVIGNADRPLTIADLWIYQREAALALMGPDGVVAEGRVDRGLLEAAPDAAGGVQLDPEAVVDEFEDVWTGGPAVVLVEGSDLVRADPLTSLASSAQQDRMWHEALRSTDSLVGRLLDAVDPASDAVLVIAPGTPSSGPRLTVAALRAPGIQPGFLQSAVTRRAGFVTITDVAPTVLELLGLDRPSAMEGRPFEVSNSGGSPSERVDTLVDADADARFRDSVLGPVAASFVALQLLLSIACGLLLWRRPDRPSLGKLTRFAALALLGFLPATYLAGFLRFSDAGVIAYAAFLVGVALAVAGGAWFAGRHELTPLQVALGVVIGVIVLSVVVLDSRLQLSTVFGDSPIVAGRFTGVNNVTSAALFASAILLAAFFVHRRGVPRGAMVATALLVVVLLVDIMPPWGSDVGGILTGVPAFALTASLLWGARVRVRWVLVFLAATVVVVAIVGGLDLMRPSAERTHLGRLFEDVSDDGWRSFELVVRRKLEQNVRSLSTSVWRFEVLAFAGFAVFLAVRARTELRSLVERIPELVPATIGLLVAAGLGFALNDSGIAVPGMMFAVINPVLVYLLLRVGTEP